MNDSPLTRLPDVTDLTPVDTDVWHLRGGFSYALALVVMLAATVVTESFGPVAAAVVLAGAVVPAAAYVVLRALDLTTRRWSLLLWPTATVASLVTLSIPSSEATTLLVGLIVLSFLFVGLTQRQGAGLLGVPVGVAAFLLASDLTIQEASIRLPIAMVVWIVVSEVPARLLEELFVREVALREAASTDSLTGLLNRSDLDLHLGALTSDVSVVLVDLDHFKRYNDENGHVQGDVALTTFASVLAAHRRSGDLVYRYGGEEFLLLLPRTQPIDALGVTVRMADALRETDIGLTFSGGIARGGPDALERADEALYAAKRAGRDRVLIADEESLTSQN